MTGIFKKVTLAFAITLALGLAVDIQPASAQQGGAVPGQSLGNLSDAQMWRAIRGGVRGTVTIPDQNAAQLVQSDGDTFQAFKNGPLAKWGGVGLGVMVALLAVFFLIRGRIKIEHGRAPDGATIERFNAFERITHWLTASSFIVLGLTGLNISYGRYVVQPVIGPEAFGAITYYGKLAHHYLAFAFMLGVLLMFVMWVRHNIPNGRDVAWLLKGGGLFSSGVHLDAPRFNAGQKLIFWSVMLGGLSLSLSGVALIFPYEVTPWAGTFSFLNIFGLNLPTEFTVLQEVQLSVLWHSIVGLIMIIIVIAHIYIGSIGMEGAFDAVGSGQVDLNWAKEHHSLWVKEEQVKAGIRQPAE